jgi:hypothetical protein
MAQCRINNRKKSNDDEIQHDDNVVPHVYVDAIFCTEYADKCHGRQRWQALKSDKG